MLGGTGGLKGQDKCYFKINSSCQLFRVTKDYIFSSVFSEQNWKQCSSVLRGKHI